MKTIAFLPLFLPLASSRSLLRRHFPSLARPLIPINIENLTTSSYVATKLSTVYRTPHSIHSYQHQVQGTEVIYPQRTKRNFTDTSLESTMDSIAILAADGIANEIKSRISGRLRTILPVSLSSGSTTI